MTVLTGEVVTKAQSSLKAFAIYLESGKAILFTAETVGGAMKVAMAVKPAQDVPEQSEAVCSVDWSWIYGRQVKGVAGSPRGDYYKLDLGDGLVITISCGMWQGDGFLSFMPYKPV